MLRAEERGTPSGLVETNTEKVVSTPTRLEVAEGAQVGDCVCARRVFTAGVGLRRLSTRCPQSSCWPAAPCVATRFLDFLHRALLRADQLKQHTYPHKQTRIHTIPPTTNVQVSGSSCDVYRKISIEEKERVANGQVHRHTRSLSQTHMRTLSFPLSHGDAHHRAGSIVGPGTHEDKR